EGERFGRRSRYRLAWRDAALSRLRGPAFLATRDDLDGGAGIRAARIRARSDRATGRRDSPAARRRPARDPRLSTGRRPMAARGAAARERARAARGARTV